MPAYAENRPIPLEVLFGNPEKTSPQISPDGTKLSYLAPLNGVLNVWVRTLGTDDDRPVTHDTGRGIQSYFWMHDGRHLLYVQDVNGNENWCLYSVELDGGKIRNYTPFKNVQARIVAGDKHIPDKLLIGMNKEDPKFHDAYLLDLNTGALTMTAKNTGDISGWVPNNRLEILGAVRTRPDGGMDILVRENEKAPWKKLIGWGLEDGMDNGPMGFSRDGSTLYIRDSKDSDTSRLKKITIKTGVMEVLGRDPEVDLGGVLFDPETYEPQLVSFLKDRVEYKILDRYIKEDMNILSGIQAGDLAIINRDDADRIWLVQFTSDTSSTAYYSYDRRSKKAVFLFKSRPVLDTYTMAPMEPIRFVSRDGLTIRGYITYPPGQERSKLPLVLNVHGGPWSRETWSYNAQAQWLANRGYICLQINFRGSTGYGKKFVNAADKEWGGAMLHDMEDAVQWAVKEGIADPKRVAIFGGSYGGYAALAGAAFSDLFSCGVDVVGPSNLISFLETIPPYWNVYRIEFYKRVGNPETERDFLRSRSPLFHVDRIKIPLLIAQGANDPRVNKAESEQIVKALEKNGIAHEYLFFPDEGHGFVKPANRLKFYTACEQFLAKQLKGR